MWICSLQVTLSLVEYPELHQTGLQVSCTYHCQACKKMQTTALWLPKPAQFFNWSPRLQCPLPDELTNRIPSKKGKERFENYFNVSVDITDGARSVPLFRTTILVYESCQSFDNERNCQSLSPSCDWSNTTDPEACIALNSNELHLSKAPHRLPQVVFFKPTRASLSTETVVEFFGDHLDTDIHISIGKNDCTNITMPEKGRFLTCRLFPTGREGPAEILLKRLSGEKISCENCSFLFHVASSPTTTSNSVLRTTGQTSDESPTLLQAIETALTSVSSGTKAAVTCFGLAVDLSILLVTIGLFRQFRKLRAENDRREKRARDFLALLPSLDVTTLGAVHRAIPHFYGRELVERQRIAEAEAIPHPTGIIAKLITKVCP